MFSASFLIISGAVIGMVVGALTGFFACLLLTLKIRLRSMLLDILLGSIAFPLGFEGYFLLPGNNTLTYHRTYTFGGVTPTVRYYDDPDFVAYVAAMLLPLLHELYRFKKRANPGKR
jgi:hypothetical protein